MNENLERMHKRQQNMIEDFLTSEEGKDWGVQHQDIPEGGKVMVIAKSGRYIDPRIVAQLHAFQKSDVLLEKDNLTRNDCADVAVHFHKTFEDHPRFKDLRDEGHVVGRLATRGAAGEKLTFFQERGHEFHIINLLEHFPERGKGFHAAIDLTARYNMDLEQGANDIFIVVADSRDELLRVLKSITHVSWEARDE